MKPSEVIKVAAMTARLLGYKVFGTDGTPGTKVASIDGSLVVVTPPAGIPAGDPWSEYVYKVVRRSSMTGDTGVWPFLSDDEMLGHFLVRLHMEKHFGIKTDHYWESK